MFVIIADNSVREPVPKNLKKLKKSLRVDNDLYPRKQLIGCLGKFCDKPCELQKEETDLTLDKCVNLIKYLGQKCNDLIIK